MSDPNKPYLIKAGPFSFPLTTADLEQADIQEIRPGVFHVIYQHRSLTCHIVSPPGKSKNVVVETDGQSFTLEIRDELDQMLDQMGFSSASTKHIKEIKAPMPGLVLDIAVTEGQAVKEGERLLILEAMKMENSILIHADAVIKEIKIKAGQAVEKGQVLITLA